MFYVKQTFFWTQWTEQDFPAVLEKTFKFIFKEGIKIKMTKLYSALYSESMS